MKREEEATVDSQMDGPGGEERGRDPERGATSQDSPGRAESRDSTQQPSDDQMGPYAGPSDTNEYADERVTVEEPD